MQCPQCNAPLEEGTVFCGNCGRQVAPFQAKGSTVAYKGGANEDDFATILTSGQGPQQSMPQTPARNYMPVPDTPYRGATPPLPPSPPPTQKSNFGRIALIAVLILLVIAGGTIGAVVLLRNNSTPKSTNPGNAPLASNATGVINFSDNQNGSGHSNVVAISATGLAAPPAGSQYDAWLLDTQNERLTSLGTLTLNNNRTSSIKFADANHNLLGLGNKFEITLEKGPASLPTGQVILSAAFPPLAFIHIKHLLFSFPNTPGKIGLLVGLVNQAQKLSSASQLLQSIAASQNTTAIQCAAQSIVDIAEGSQGSHYQPLPSQCTSANIAEVGDGYGLLGSGGYIANGEAHATLAASQSDTTPNIRVHAGHVGICLENMKGWITTVDQDALALLNNPTNTAKVQEMVTLANHALNGVDTNGDESIDPVPGEGGAATAYFHGQLMAALVLAPGS